MTKKEKRIIAALVWTECLSVIIIFTIYVLIAFQFFPEEIGDRIADAIQDTDGGHQVAIVFGGIVWVVIYAIVLGLSICGYRNGIKEFVISCVVHAVYHLVRWPIFGLMMVFADTHPVNNSLAACAFWFDSITIIIVGLGVLIVWGTISACA